LGGFTAASLVSSSASGKPFVNESTEFPLLPEMTGSPMTQTVAPNRPEVLIPYVGGPLNGSYTSFPREGLVLDGVLERDGFE
jgi:hypothetical protein